MLHLCYIGATWDEDLATTNVRIKSALLPPLKHLVHNSKNALGLPKYSSVSNLVSEVLEDFLVKENSKPKVQLEVPA
jgi:hypothetical protein